MDICGFFTSAFSSFYNAVFLQTKHSFGGNTSKIFVFSYPIKNSFRVTPKAVVVQTIPLQHIEMAFKSVCSAKRKSIHEMANLHDFTPIFVAKMFF